MKYLGTIRGEKPWLWAAFCGLLGLACALNPWTQKLEGRFLDMNFQSHRQGGPRPAKGPGIVIVGLDEGSLRGIPEPLALYHRHLESFMKALAQAEPAAVGVDLVLPDRSWDAFSPGLDAALTRGILTLKRQAPLVLGRSENHGLPRPIHPPFETAAGLDHIGFVQCPVDSDRVVRRFETHLGADGAAVPTLAERILWTQGRQARSGLIDFTVGPPFEYIPFQRVLQWGQAGDSAQLRKAFAGRIVLLGSVVPYEDTVPLPVQLAAWEPATSLDSPGVLLQGQILRAQLSEGIIPKPSPWLMALQAMATALGGMFLARFARTGFLLLAGCHGVLLAGTYLLLGQQIFLPVVPALTALDLAFLLSARRQAWQRIASETKERRVLERALLDTSERERREIGHELHDGACQQITGALLRCRVAEQSLAKREAPEVVHLQAMSELLNTCLDETHHLATGLSPGQLIPGGLGSALEELARRTRETHEVICEFTQDGNAAAVDGLAATQLYRIAQEAVTNALKHAAPSEIRITLGKVASNLQLGVENDGQPLHFPLRPGGMGQRIMRYRAELIGGQLTLKARDGGGAVLLCTLH